MIWRVTVFLCFLACLTDNVKAQQCVPEPVFNVDLADTTLSWDPSTNCETTHYIVNIHSGGILEYVYQVDGPSLDVSFLYHCRSYTFTIVAIADHIIGLDTKFDATLPLPAGTNITIEGFSGTQIDRDVLLQWHVAQEHLYCAQNYRLLLYTEDSADPEDITTNQNGYYIIGVSQCQKFQVEVSVRYLSFSHPTAEFNYTVPAATNSPSLVAVEKNAISINTTWRLESYSLNRCNVSALVINGSRFNATIPILDLPSRPDIEVSIPGLRADSMYFLNVTTENEAGTSRPFQLAVQTDPLDPVFALNNENVDHYDDNNDLSFNLSF